MGSTECNSLQRLKFLWKANLNFALSLLVYFFVLRYSAPAAAKSAAGFRSLNTKPVTHM
jgi:hypothetical protein